MSDKNVRVDKKIFDGDKILPASNINPYLVDAPTIFIESRAKHIQNFVPRITHGNKKNDLAVAKAYGFEEILDDEAAIVAELFDMYDALTKA